jgi:NAD(P)-dependent dehydrogenase (short-subunit alcohol dehydrogenase family)
MTAASVHPDLTGQVALVTGAARGQGRGHCLALAEAGAAVAALDICRDLDVPAYSLGTRAELDAVVAAIRAAGGRALPIVADVRDPASVADAVAAVEAEFGRLDILVNNAAIVTSAPFWELTEAQWCAVVDTNLSGVWRTTKAAAPLLRRSPRGRIVHISSTAGARAVPEFAHLRRGQARCRGAHPGDGDRAGGRRRHGQRTPARRRRLPDARRARRRARPHPRRRPQALAARPAARGGHPAL